MPNASAFSSPECETAGTVEQHVVHGIADAAAHGAEPEVGELPGRQTQSSAPTGLDIALDAEHELSRLPVVAVLHTTRNRGGLARLIIDTTPAVSEVSAEIGEPAQLSRALSGYGFTV